MSLRRLGPGLVGLLALGAAPAACGDNLAPAAGDGGVDAAAIVDAPIDAGALDLADASVDAEVTHTVRIVLAGGGAGRVQAVGKPPCDRACTFEVPHRTVVSLSAEPGDAWMFTGWDGRCHGIGTCDVYVDHDVEVTATFEPYQATWAMRQGGVEWDETLRLTSLPAGDLIAAGLFAGAASFGGPKLDGTGPGNDFYVARYRGDDGAHVWSTHIVGPVLDVAATRAGDVVILVQVDYWAKIADKTWYGPKKGLLVALLDGSSGAALWVRPFGDLDDHHDIVQTHAQLALAPDGDVFVHTTLSTSGETTLDLGPLHFQGDAGGDLLLVRLNGATGAPRWGAVFGGPGRQTAGAVAVDPDGHAIVAARFGDALAIGPHRFATTAGEASVLLQILDPDLTVGWSRDLGAGSVARMVTVGERLAVLGSFEDPVDLGGGALAPQAAVPDAFVGRLDASTGRHVWSRAIDQGGTMLLPSAAMTTDGRVLVAGHLGRAQDVAGVPVYPTGTYNGIVVALGAADGHTERVLRLGGPTSTRIQALTVASTGAVFAAGALFRANVVGGFALRSLEPSYDALLLRLTADALAPR